MPNEILSVAKAGGLKTEPAFAKVLGLGDEALRDIIRHAGYAAR